VSDDLACHRAMIERVNCENIELETRLKQCSTRLQLLEAHVAQLALTYSQVHTIKSEYCLHCQCLGHPKESEALDILRNFPLLQ
jgi:hypothetical protein